MTETADNSITSRCILISMLIKDFTTVNMAYQDLLASNDN